MKIYSILLIALLISGCDNNVRKIETVQIEVEPFSDLLANSAEVQTLKSSSFFDLLREPISTIEKDSLPFNYEVNYTQREIETLQLDTSIVRSDEFYCVIDDPFLKDQYLDFKMTTYYRSVYGNIVEKLVRIENSDTTFNLLISSQFSNGLDDKEITTEFINESNFLKKQTTVRLISDDSEKTTYSIELVNTQYTYDLDLNFSVLSTDTSNFIKKVEHSNHNKTYYFIRSSPLQLNNRNYVWEYKTGYIDEFLSYDIDLIDKKTGKNVLVNKKEKTQGYYYEEYPFYKKLTNLLNSSPSYRIHDLNFDGFEDVSIYNQSASGSAGAYDNSFLFNPKNQSYEHSELCSGYNLSIEKDQQVITTCGKGGYGLYRLKKVTFSNKSEVEFIEYFSSDPIDSNLSIFRYRKEVNGKVTQTRTDTIQEDFFHWVNPELKE